MPFKFQSDSINTEKLEGAKSTVRRFKFQSDSINTSALLWNLFDSLSFKFQSDSINTFKRKKYGGEYKAHLNSNLILLIQMFGQGC